MPFFDYLTYQNQAGAPSNPNIGKEVTPAEHTPAGKLTFSSTADLLDYVRAHPEDKDAYNLLMSIPNGPQLMQGMDAYDKLQQDGNWRDFNLAANSLGDNVGLAPGTQDAVNNMIANQNTEEARAFDKEMRDTSLTSAAEQLESLGLSSSNVIQTGGLQGNGVAAASVDKSNSAFQDRMNKFNQKMGIVKQILGMTSQMAAAGIYGGSIGLARKAGGILASQASHSALGVFNGSHPPLKHSSRPLSSTRERMKYLLG